MYCLSTLNTGTDHTQSLSILQRVRGHKISQQSKHPLFSPQWVLEPIMCGISLWICPAVQGSVPSGPYLEEGCDLQAESWTPRHWASHICIIQHSNEANAVFLHNAKTQSTKKSYSHYSFREKSRFIQRNYISWLMTMFLV